MKLRFSRCWFGCRLSTFIKQKQVKHKLDFECHEKYIIINYKKKTTQDILSITNRLLCFVKVNNNYTRKSLKNL